MDQLLLRRRMLNMFRDEYIVFEDAEAERVCATNWGDGTHITKRDAAKVTADQFKTAFVNNTTIVNFDEFKYFTSITEMQGNANQWFSGCTALKKLSLPEKLATLNNNNVANGIFKSCSSLEEITFPNTLTRIGRNTFYTNSGASLAKANVPSVEWYTNVVFANHASSPFYNSTASTRGIYVNGTLVTHIIIPEGVTSLTIGFLYKNNTVTEITIPTTLTSTNTYSFHNASAISRVNISDLEKYLRISWNNTSGYPFVGNSSGGELYLNGQKVTSVTIPSTITEVKMHAFHRVRGITSLTLHNNITTIGLNAFTDGEFTQVTIPSSVTTIGNQAFSYCTNLTSITVPASVTSIGTEVFERCTSLADAYMYEDNANFRDLAYTTGTIVGNGTGTLYFDKNCTCGSATQGSLYFKRYVFNADLTLSGSINQYNPNATTGSNVLPIEEFRVKGNVTNTSTSTSSTVFQVNNNLVRRTNFAFAEIMGTFTTNGYFINSPDNMLAQGFIWHLGYNGIATTSGKIHASSAKVSKIYVGDGSSQAADQAVLDQYLADTNWAQYASKLDLWYNYNGTYKTS